MLASPFDRRLVYLTGKAPGFMLLVQQILIDKQRIELVSDEGGIPLHLDLYKVFGSGKANITSNRTLKQAIRSVLVPALDRFFDQPEIFRAL
jgi:hypothetical protein